MRILNYKKQMVVALHLLFWIVSINAWNIVFNPGVEASTPIKGLQDYWFDLLLLDLLFFLYCLMPFIWFVDKARKWIKWTVTVFFLIPVGYLVVEYLKPAANREDLSLFTDLFLSGFMYVVVFHLTIAAAVYLNLFIFIDNYLKNSRFAFYLLAVTSLSFVTAVANFALFDFIIDKLFPSLYFISYFEIWELFLIVGSYLVVTTVLLLIWRYAAVLVANRDKAVNELSALKAQINPHFLFNNLNTIYSMASQNDARTKDVILQLSDFLRYVLYDTTSEFIPMEKEAEIIRTYVELQKSRLQPNGTTVVLNVEGNYGSSEIAPLLLLPLAENCFKHGIGKNPGKILLSITCQGKKLVFRTENPIYKRDHLKEEETAHGGIGISNVEKRLNLLYPNRSSLHYGDIDGIFHLEMKIEL